MIDEDEYNAYIGQVNSGMGAEMPQYATPCGFVARPIPTDNSDTVLPCQPQYDPMSTEVSTMCLLARRLTDRKHRTLPSHPDSHQGPTHPLSMVRMTPSKSIELFQRLTRNPPR